MCGIVGYVGKQSAVPIIMQGLAKLEYRGYDSAGIAVWQDNKIKVEKTVGRLNRLVERLESNPLAGSIGMGQTRWATHGKTTSSACAIN